MGKRALIVNTAAKVFAREGYNNTKVQMIADEAGVAVGTIYHYYKGKQEIIEDIYVSECDKLSGYIDSLEDKNISIVEKIEAYVNFLIKQLEHNTYVLKVLIQLYSPEFRNNLVMKTALDNLVSKLAQVLEVGKQRGEIADLEVYPFANIITQTVKGAFNSFIADGINYESRKRQLVEFIIKGIRK